MNVEPRINYTALSEPGRKKSKRYGDKWLWVVSVDPATAAVWAERTCEVTGNAAKTPVKLYELVFLLTMQMPLHCFITSTAQNTALIAFTGVLLSSF